MFTVRMYLFNKHGRNIFRLSNPAITRNSVVHISVTEATEIPLGSLTKDFTRFIGSANFTVHNIAPADGHVDFAVTIDWPHPLNIVTDISIFDPVRTEEVVVGT